MTPYVIYLTNACGDKTGYGTITLSDKDLDKVPFENGPGFVLPYIVEINQTKYLLGNLEVAYEDEFWGEEEDFPSLQEVQVYCEAVHRGVKKNLRKGELLLDIDDGDPGRLVVGVATPLDQLRDDSEASEALGRIFGRFADLPSLEDCQ